MEKDLEFKKLSVCFALLSPKTAETMKEITRQSVAEGNESISLKETN